MRRATLYVRKANRRPARYELDPGLPLTIGRHRGNLVVLDDPHASRWHAEVACEGGRWLLREREALNGTFLNGRRLAGEAELHAGDELLIGDTVLEFRLAAEDRHDVPTPEDPSRPAAPPAGGAADDNLETASLHTDDLSALCRFMQASLRERTPRDLVLRALTAALLQTGATAAGYVGFEQDDPLPRLVVPERARVDVHLSRQLSGRVREENRLLWLAEEKADFPDSIGSFQDALGLPLPGADGAPVGALHVYRSAGTFHEHHARFCQVLAGSLAQALQVLRVRRQLEADNSRLRHKASAGADVLLGDSAALGQLREAIALLAQGPATVLIEGESGVGKELVALALHRESARRQGPLVTVNCAALPGTLLESELFGHKKGAYTGATEDRRGLFEQADEGTLFLDEIGELSADCQAKLLRVIEGKGFRRVGGNDDVRVDVRILAATNRDLEAEMRAGRFRKDLYYRLGIPLRVPPLREHAEDIPALAEHFLVRLSVEYHRPLRLTAAALARLRSYAWPGNVRQLRSVLETAVAMTRGEAIDAGDLPPGLSAGGPSGEPRGAAPAAGPGAGRAPEAGGPAVLNLEELEAQAIREALRQTRGNKVQAARLLGIHRDTLQLKLKKMEGERGVG